MTTEEELIVPTPAMQKAESTGTTHCATCGLDVQAGTPIPCPRGDCPYPKAPTGTAYPFPRFARASADSEIKESRAPAGDEQPRP